LEDIIEEIRGRPRWSAGFTAFRRPYVHLAPEEYRTLAERAGLRVAELRVTDEAWDFATREAFVAFAQATFVEWTQHLLERAGTAFTRDVLDRYRAVAASGPQDANTFKFYQMEAELRRP